MESNKPTRRKRSTQRDWRDIEHAHQCGVIKWARLNEKNDPRLALLHAIPNGGKRDARTGAKMKAEGALAGIPDLCLPVARGGYFGCYIEMKTARGVQTPSQRVIAQRLLDEGYFLAVCRSAVEAINVLEQYLAFEPTIPIRPIRVKL